MATQFGGSVNTPLFSSDKPWIWAMIPVGFVIVVGALALCLHSRRRVKHFEAGLAATSPGGGTRLDPAGTRALERDLEEAWVRGATPTRRPPPGARYPYHGRSGSGGAPSAAAGRWTRPTSRWNWAGAVSRQEEGLNELGEAPPPYEKQQPQPEGNAEGVRKSSSTSIDGNVGPSSRNTSTTNLRGDSVELQSLSPPPPRPAVLATRAIAATQSIPNEMGESVRSRERERPTSAVEQIPPPPAYDSDRAESSTPVISTRRGEEESQPPPPMFLGAYDDGTAVVTVTPVPAAVLPSSSERRST
ncbi:hypothetical protein V8F20_011823 [Naviculisporaceae sp. PSN 640]